MQTSLKTIAVLALVLSLSACGITGPAYAPPDPQTAVTVDMDMMSFKPPKVTIRSGETIEWRNTSPITHTVSGISFDSGDMKAGDVYKHTFSMPGQYRYYCKYHEQHGMVGTVIVKP